MGVSRTRLKMANEEKISSRSIFLLGRRLPLGRRLGSWRIDGSACKTGAAEQ